MVASTPSTARPGNSARFCRSTPGTPLAFSRGLTRRFLMLSSPRYSVVLLSLGLVAGACASDAMPEEIEPGDELVSGKADSAIDGIVGSWQYLPPPTALLVGPSYMTFMQDMT